MVSVLAAQVDRNLLANPDLEGELQGQQGRFAFDPQLGHIPRPDYRSTAVNHDSSGLRISPSTRNLPSKPPVLTTGENIAT